jgi:hypothetical protein
MAAPDGEATGPAAQHRGPPYAGIGSRETPADVLGVMESIAARLARRRWVLRTGASPGADQAFYRGARAAGGRVELFLPWPDFQANSWSGADPRALDVLSRPTKEACELAARFSPDWERLEGRERRLFARDAHQVLGADLASPARCVICWTADGSLDGSGAGADGTRQALRIASHHRIAVFNLARADHLRRLTEAQPNGWVCS